MLRAASSPTSARYVRFCFLVTVPPSYSLLQRPHDKDFFVIIKMVTDMPSKTLQPVSLAESLLRDLFGRGPETEPVVFQTLEDVTIPASRPTAYQVERGRAVKDVGVAAGVATPKGPDQLPFGMPPQVGDALYLGFEG